MMLEVDQSVWVWSTMMPVGWYQARIVDRDLEDWAHPYRIFCEHDLSINWRSRAQLRTDEEHAAYALAQ